MASVLIHSMQIDQGVSSLILLTKLLVLIFRYRQHNRDYLRESQNSSIHTSRFGHLYAVMEDQKSTSVPGAGNRCSLVQYRRTFTVNICLHIQHKHVPSNHTQRLLCSLQKTVLSNGRFNVSNKRLWICKLQPW
jgi:hypothetical protein